MLNDAFHVFRFTHDDGYLLSTGGADKCVFLWRTDCIEEAREQDVARTRGSDGLSGMVSGSTGKSEELRSAEKTSKIEESVDSVVVEKSAHSKVGWRRASVTVSMSLTCNMPLQIMVGAPSGGDEFMAVKPWIGAIREPSSWKESRQTAEAAAPPPAELELNFVYGYRAQDVRSNLFYAGSGSEIVYHAAAVGVVYDSERHKQRYNLSHTDDIISLATYGQGSMIATGTLGSDQSSRVLFNDTHRSP